MDNEEYRLIQITPLVTSRQAFFSDTSRDVGIASRDGKIRKIDGVNRGLCHVFTF